jgi:ATP-dependent Clp protease ATP-binding subunit ClpX
MSEEKNEEKQKEKEQNTCSFCNLSKEEVPHNIIIGNQDASARICANCAQKALNKLEQFLAGYDIDYYKQLTPQKIKCALDEHVIDQEEAKIKASVAVYNHIKKEKIEADSDIQLKKSNLLLVGPTGVGKTLMAQALSETLKVPFYIADATGLTEAGYAGNDVENILWGLLTASNFNIPLAERGIVYIDEIDKLAKKFNAEHSLNKDVSGEGVQQALLKILEGGIITVTPPGRRLPTEEGVEIDTTNILFILGGMFNGIQEIKEDRIRIKKKVGFQCNTGEVDERPDQANEVTAEDLIKFGFIPEFIGRIQVIAELNELNEKAMKEILTEPKNNVVEQFKALFQGDDVKLVFEDGALDAIVTKAITQKTGARALKNVLEEVMLSIMYELPSQKNIEECIITKKFIEKYNEGQKPKYINKKQKNKNETLQITEEENNMPQKQCCEA